MLRGKKEGQFATENSVELCMGPERTAQVGRTERNLANLGACCCVGDQEDLQPVAGR